MRVRGHRERLLRGFLGEVKVAEEADQGGQDAALVAAMKITCSGKDQVSRCGPSPGR
jgi:hypothetical protein